MFKHATPRASICPLERSAKVRNMWAKGLRRKAQRPVGAAGASWCSRYTADVRTWRRVMLTPSSDMAAFSSEARTLRPERGM